MYGQVGSVTIWKFCHQQNNYQKEVKKKKIKIEQQSQSWKTYQQNGSGF